MLFSVYTIAKPDSDQVIQELLAEHRAYIEPRMSSVYLGGPLLAEDGKRRIGGLMIMEFNDQNEAENWFTGQPYAKAGIIERIVIHPFIPLVVRGVLQAE